jgi:hypothetical protein
LHHRRPGIINSHFDRLINHVTEELILVD